MAIEQEISQVAAMHSIGSLALETQPLKYSLKSEAASWKAQYAKNLHKQGSEDLKAFDQYMRDTTLKLNRKVEDLEDVRFIMGVLKEVQNPCSNGDLTFSCPSDPWLQPPCPCWHAISHLISSAVAQCVSASTSTCLQRCLQAVAACLSSQQAKVLHGGFCQVIMHCTEGCSSASFWHLLMTLHSICS